MGILQKRLGGWIRWWNTEIKVNPTRSRLTLYYLLFSFQARFQAQQIAEREEKMMAIKQRDDNIRRVATAGECKSAIVDSRGVMIPAMGSDTESDFQIFG